MTETLGPEQLAAYQTEMVGFILDTPKCALWVDMGLGKTIATLTAIKELLDDFEARRVLIIAPLRVAKSTWPDEIQKRAHINDVAYSVIVGTADERKRALKRDVDLYFINRENVVWLLDQLNDKWPFETMIIDESSSFRNHQSKRFRALKKVAHLCTRVIELTGTPAPKDLLGLWAQIYLLDQGERLGRTITAYRDRWFRPDYLGYSWDIKEGAQEEIEGYLSDIVLVLKAGDFTYWDEPEQRRVNIDLPAMARDQYTELENEFIVRLENAEVIEAVNAAVLTGKLRQCANGAFYTDEHGTFVEVHDAKLNALQFVINKHPGENILCAYNFVSDKERILKRFPHAEVLTVDPDVIRRWNAGKIPLLLAHPASAGHGLNLQHGGRIAVWFGDTWDLELHLQFNARLARRGQEKDVIIYHLCVKDTVDETIIRTIKNRNRSQRALLDALKKDITRKGDGLKKAA